MTRTQLTTGIAVTSALAVLAIFFGFTNPFPTPLGTSSDSSAAAAAASANEQFIVQDELIGTGDVALPGKLVTINYIGKFKEGGVFDTSIGRAPYQFTLGAGDVIRGLDQGISGMKVGGKRLLIIPPSLAYGANGAAIIPPNSTLVFEVTLLKVEDAN